jgi:hypothetical protein
MLTNQPDIRSRNANLLNLPILDGPYSSVTHPLEAGDTSFMYCNNEKEMGDVQKRSTLHHQELC